MAIVSAREFTYTYPGAEQPTLKKVSFEVERGEVVGLIGPVGAGKTTLCMAMAQIAPRILGGEADGQLTVLDREEHEGSDVEPRHRLGMVFEDYAAQLTQLKVIEDVMAPLCNFGTAPPDAERRAHELLKKVGSEARI